jgi:sulfatase modifying factor 1
MILLGIATFCVVALIIFYGGRFRSPVVQAVGKNGAPIVLIPPGSFLMGSSDGEPNEKPVHTVYLPGFYMDKNEVTTALYVRFLEATGRDKPFKWNEVDLRKDGDRPVVGVSWYDAQAYCQWVEERLPTEAEWEKAARGTNALTYPWGNEDPSEARGNFDRGFHWQGYATLAVVGSFELGKSPYGINDLAGNVSEWTADWYDPQYYETSPARNPTGPALTEQSKPFSLDIPQRKVVRGGSWTSGPQGMRSSIRGESAPTNRHSDVGFRCVSDAK